MSKINLHLGVFGKSSLNTTQKENIRPAQAYTPNGDKRYIKRNEKGQITESDDQGKSLSQDIRKTAKTKVKAGYGDKGDQAKKSPAPVKKAAKKK